MKILALTYKAIGDKRQWRAYQARVKQLPENYRETVDAFERYLMQFGGADGDAAMAMFDDLVELFEQAAADHKTVREIVGANPVEFIDELIASYDTRGGYVTREQDRLVAAIDKAERP